MAEEIIQVEQVSMRFRMANDRIVSLKEYVIAFLKRKLKYRDFWVFQDISFQVNKGEVVGIIGKNGAGKSTLLKIIAGVLTPTKGKVTLQGKVVPMLELGSGFDVELSGRENIFLNGSILGYGREFLEEKYQEILEFSELEEFIEMPIRNYSSGMLMRLAFSIATIVKPEILIVDEILAVGDEAFQRKSKRKMLELMSGGTTVLFVSHSIDQIREMCQRVIWLEHGTINMIGEAKKVCDAYQEFMNPAVSLKEQVQERRQHSDAEKYYMDVLLIYGELGEDYEWRVHNQKEQLLAGNMPAAEIEYQDFTEQYMANYRVFFFIGCADTKRLREQLKRLKQNRKTVLFDCRGLEEWRSNTIFLAAKEEIDGIVAATEAAAEEAKREGFLVYWNRDVCSDRVEQLSEWAVYDRDVLPGLDVSQMSGDMEVVNYYRAVKKKEERGNGIGRIGCFDRNIERVNQLLQVVLSDKKQEVFIRADWKENSVIEQGERIRYLESTEPEMLPRMYADMDLILAVIDTDRDRREVYQQQIYAGLVKTPLFIWDRTGEEKADREGVILAETAEEFYQIVKQQHQDSNRVKQIVERVWKQVKEEATAIQTGWRFRVWIQQQEKPQVVFLMNHKLEEEKQQQIFLCAKQCKERGMDVLLLWREKGSEWVQEEPSGILSLVRAEVYIYGAMDRVVAASWEECEFLQSYRNIRKCFFLQQEEQMEEYACGDYNRFRMMQTYEPCMEWILLAKEPFIKQYADMLEKQRILVRCISSDAKDWYQEF